MYKKKSKLNERAIDKKLESICKDLLSVNEDAIFAISKKFVENSDKSLGIEVADKPVIVTTKKIEELNIPSCFRIVGGNYLTTWCDNEILIKLIYSEMKFIDGEVKGKTIKNYYLDIDKDDEFKKSKILSF